MLKLRGTQNPPRPVPREPPPLNSRPGLHRVDTTQPSSAYGGPDRRREPPCPCAPFTTPPRQRYRLHWPSVAVWLFAAWCMALVTFGLATLAHAIWRHP